MARPHTVSSSSPQGEPTPIVESGNPHDPASMPAAAPQVGAYQPAAANAQVSGLPLVMRGRAVNPQLVGGAPGMPVSGIEQRIGGDAQSTIGSAIGVYPMSESAQRVPPPRKYRVLNGGRVAIDGNVTLLRPGKELDERQYDLRLLKQQGIRLEEVRDDDEYVAPVDPGIEEQVPRA